MCWAPYPPYWKNQSFHGYQGAFNNRCKPTKADLYPLELRILFPWRFKQRIAPADIRYFIPGQEAAVRVQGVPC